MIRHMILAPRGDLRSQHIALGWSCPDRPTLFRKIGDLAAFSFQVASNRVATALAWREALGSTAIGQSAALPHARIDELSYPVAFFFRLPSSISFDAEDRSPVDAIFALLYPIRHQEEAFAMLRQAARALRQPGLRRDLAQTRFPDEAECIWSRLLS